jgi:hypothetical protein
LAISFTAQSAFAFSGSGSPELRAAQRPVDQLLKPPANAVARVPARLRRVTARHAVLVDANGLWAWNPHDAHAGATRHASLPCWVEKNPNSEMQVLVSAPLVRSVCQLTGNPLESDAAARERARRALIEVHGHIASSWPLAVWASSMARGVCALAGIDLTALRRHALRHDVEVQSIAPWWHHAFEEAKRCVSALNQAKQSYVCVVEGVQIAWISCSGGELAEIRQLRLTTPTVDALRLKIAELCADCPVTFGPADRIPTVVLGQGLTDGARTRSLDAVVLGRLDGDQPPQWLRPSARADFL